ncbi:MAG: EAL domain-containing protein [Cellvibrionaceae bacterium]
MSAPSVPPSNPFFYSLARLPIRTLVVALLLLSLGVGGLLLAWILVSTETRSIYNRYSQDLELDGAAIVRQIAVDADTGNLQSTRQLMSFYGVRAEVEQLMVISAEGKVLLSNPPYFEGQSFRQVTTLLLDDALPQELHRNINLHRDNSRIQGAFRLPHLHKSPFSQGFIWISLDVNEALRTMWGRLVMELAVLILVSLASIGLIYSLLSRQLLSPLERLQEFTKRIAQGRLGEQVSGVSSQELQDLVSSINTMSHKLGESFEEVKLQNRALEQIISALEEKQDELRVAAYAFETEEAILITDADSNVVKVNTAFTKISGYEASEVLGKNPNILASGRHDKKFYENMWRDINVRGVWRGEIWNKRKDGTIFPELQTITAVKDMDGQVTHYVACFSDITERKETEQKVARMAFYDELTGLPNRRMFSDSLEQALAFSTRMKQCGAVIFIDLDHFKEVNDSMGHLAGDELLKLVGKRLKRHLRVEDVLARFGGDEFVLLANGLGVDRDEAVMNGSDLAHRMMKDLNEPFSIQGRTVHITGSVGVAIFPGDAEDAESLLQKADTAMYHSKEKGRRSVHFFSDAMQSIVDERFHIRHELRKAIESDSLSLHLQPQVDLDSGKIEGAECLLRWTHPDDGFISPVVFIPIAEGSDLIIQLDKWVIRSACKLMKRLESKGIFLPRLSINVSAKHFHRSSFVGFVKNTIEEYGCDAGRLCIELTEGAFISDMDLAIERMNQLRETGLEIAVDDFGTGYSSLSYLEKMPITELKIDKTFVDKVPLDKRGTAVAGTIIELGQQLDFRIVAEGVESAAQVEFLKTARCDVYQGYHFSRPLAETDFEAFWKQTGHCLILSHSGGQSGGNGSGRGDG